jgi:hypothetical protein
LEVQRQLSAKLQRSGVLNLQEAEFGYLGATEQKSTQSRTPLLSLVRNWSAQRYRTEINAKLIAEHWDDRSPFYQQKLLVAASLPLPIKVPHSTMEMPRCVATRFSSRSGGLSFLPSTRPGWRREHICTAIWGVFCISQQKGSIQNPCRHPGCSISERSSHRMLLGAALDVNLRAMNRMALVGWMR